MIAIVVAVALWLLMRLRRSVRADDESAERKAPPAAAKAAMIACAHCGVHLPREEALVGPEERRYCSEAHRALGPR